MLFQISKTQQKPLSDWRSCRHPANRETHTDTRWQRFPLNSSYTWERQTDQEYRGGGWRTAEENRDIERENGRSRDLSVMPMNTDKPTLWIMFLSLSTLITVFLVKTNPRASVHLQSAGMFVANSWKKRTKRGCQGRQSQSHLYHCHPLWIAHSE